MRATASAPSNIALVKYWGKRDVSRNVPATGSISMSLADLRSVTTVSFEPTLARDEIRIDGRTDPPGAPRVIAFLDLLRLQARTALRARVETTNNFPTGAGLASSASGFAALTVAADAALGLGLPPHALSALARRGSGSAARSLVSGWAEMAAGTAPDGADAFAWPIAPPDHFPVSVLVAVTSRSPKAVGSTAGMTASAATSPYYGAWLDLAEEALGCTRAAVLAGDLPAAGALAEEHCLRMHAVMLGNRPPLLYWTPATVAVIHEVRRLREEEGLRAWFTIDAGPQVKVLCDPTDERAVHDRLASLPGVEEVLATRPGAGAQVVPEPA
jgi:diphosphomevalonate decarboxylase